MATEMRYPDVLVEESASIAQREKQCHPKKATLLNKLDWHRHNQMGMETKEQKDVPVDLEGSKYGVRWHYQHHHPAMTGRKKSKLNNRKMKL